MGTSQQHLVGACDLGTYSGLILIARRARRGWSVLAEEQHTLDLLGDGVDRGRLPYSAIARAEGLVQRFDDLTERHACDSAAVVATAALRNAANRSEIVRRLRQSTRHPVRVLGTRREGVLSARGALIGLPRFRGHSIIVDIGGGSTEAIRETDTGFVFRGVPWGASKATAAWFGDQPTKRQQSRIDLMDEADAVMRGLPGWNRARDQRLVGIGGTIVTLAALQARHRRFDPQNLHGRELTRSWLERTAKRLAGLSRSQKEHLIPFDPRRARVITAGTFLWAGVLNRFDVDRVTVSARGLRWGVADYLVEHRRI